MANKKKLKPVAKKIKILKVEPVEGEPEKQRVELEIEGAPIALPDHPIQLPVELAAPEFLALGTLDAQHIPEEKKGIIAWLKSWWD
jgi:hypothetical protein